MAYDLMGRWVRVGPNILQGPGGPRSEPPPWGEKKRKKKKAKK